jgi:transposase InsO family protein
VTEADWVAARRVNALFDAHRDDPEFGYRFLADEAREEGQAMADRTAWRICSTNGWWSVFGKKRGRNGKKKRKPGTPAFDDLVKRDFTAAQPNTLWLVEMSEHWNGEGKLYLCAIKDCFSNKIVRLLHRLAHEGPRLAVNALNNAVARRATIAPMWPAASSTPIADRKTAIARRRTRCISGMSGPYVATPDSGIDPQ